MMGVKSPHHNNQKNMIKIQGIYKIRNCIDRRIYVGQSVDIENRFSCHKSEALKTKRNHPLYNAMRKYGIDNFEFIILEKVDNVLLLDSREQYWMDHYISYERDSGYNLSRDSSVNRGYKTSLEHKKKCSERQKRLCKNPAYIKNISDKLKIKNLDKEWQNKIRTKQKLVLQKPEYRKQNSERLKKLWQEPEYRAKMLEGRKNGEEKRMVTVNTKKLFNPDSYINTIEKRKLTSINNGNTKIHLIDKEKVRDLYLVKNNRLVDVAKILNISEGLLAKFLQKENLKKPRNLYRKIPVIITDSDIHKICDSVNV